MRPDIVIRFCTIRCKRRIQKKLLLTSGDSFAVSPTGIWHRVEQSLDCSSDFWTVRKAQRKYSLLFGALLEDLWCLYIWLGKFVLRGICHTKQLLRLAGLTPRKTRSEPPNQMSSVWRSRPLNLTWSDSSLWCHRHCLLWSKPSSRPLIMCSKRRKSEATKPDWYYLWGGGGNDIRGRWVGSSRGRMWSVTPERPPLLLSVEWPP